MEKSRLYRTHIEEEFRLVSQRILESDEVRNKLKESLSLLEAERQMNSTLKQEFSLLKEQFVKMKWDDNIRILQLEEDRANLRSTVSKLILSVVMHYEP